MPDVDFTALFEKLGKIGEKIDNLDEKVDDLRDTTNQRHTENQGRFVELERGAAASSQDRREINAKLDVAGARIEAIEKPVNDFVALRNRVGAYISIIIAAAFFVWFFISPFWGVIERKIIFWIFPGLRPNP